MAAKEVPVKIMKVNAEYMPIYASTSEQDLKSHNISTNTEIYIPTPADIIQEMKSGGVLNNEYRKLLDKNYKAMIAHQKYYNEVMAQWHYDVPDPIPSRDVHAGILFSFHSFLFGWFAFKVVGKDPNNPESYAAIPDTPDEFLDPFVINKKISKLYVLEDAVKLMKEYIEDISNNRAPRCTRDI